jgi:hypothetical protein
MRTAWRNVRHHLDSLTNLNLSSREMLRSRRDVGPRRRRRSSTVPSDGFGATLHFFRPAVVQRVRLAHASKSSRRVRCWLMLNEPDSSMLGWLWTQVLISVVLGSYVVYAVRTTTADGDENAQLQRTQFALEMVIALDWMFRMMLAASLDLMPRVRAVQQGRTSVLRNSVAEGSVSQLEMAAGAPLRMGTAALVFLVCDGMSLAPFALNLISLCASGQLQGHFDVSGTALAVLSMMRVLRLVSLAGIA